MTFDEYKQLTRDKLDHDLWEAKIQAGWYAREVVNHKYNSVTDASEKLGVWNERVESLEKRKKMLEEMFDNVKLK